MVRRRRRLPLALLPVLAVALAVVFALPPARASAALATTDDIDVADGLGHAEAAADAAQTDPLPGADATALPEVETDAEAVVGEPDSDPDSDYNHDPASDLLPDADADAAAWPGADTDAATAVDEPAEEASANLGDDPAAADAALLQALDDAAWIGDGAPSQRHVYVLFATDCSWSRTLFEQSRQRDDGMQLRWLVMAGPGAEWLAGANTLDALADAFAGGAAGQAAPASGSRALDSHAWLQPMLGAGLRVPTLVYLADDGVRIQAGLRAGAADLPAPTQVADRPDRAQHRPAIHRLLARPLPDWQPAPAGPYIRFHAEPAPVHALPSRDSLQVGELPHLGSYATVLGLVGDDWIEVAGLRVADRGGRTLSAYIHAPEAVALMRMSFELLPAEGVVVAGESPRPMHSHPSLQAPVLRWLDPGYQMDRAGEVLIDGQAWDAVVLFTDGGHAYLPR